MPAAIAFPFFLVCSAAYVFRSYFPDVLIKKKKDCKNHNHYIEYFSLECYILEGLHYSVKIYYNEEG